MTENRILPFTTFQRDRCFQLANAFREINSYDEMLRKGNGRPVTVVIDQQKTLEIDAQYLKGMKTCASSFYFDLKDQGLKEVADEILQRIKNQTTTVR